MLKKMKFYLIGAALCCLVTGLYYTLKSNENPQTSPKANHDYMGVTNHFVSRVTKLWQLGDIEGKYAKDKLNCPKFIKYNSLVAKRYLECNPRYLECLFSQKSLEKDGFSFSLNKVISYRPTSIEFTLSHSQESFSKTLILNFKNTCHESALPKMQYTLESLEGRTWSSKKREIYIDKFLVSQNELNFWKPHSQDDVTKWGLTALGLSQEKQESFCRSRGKRLLTTQIFEAAVRLKPSSKLSIYPWTHYSANSKEGLNKATLNQELCSKAFLKECTEDFKWIAYLGDSVSWTGIHDVFGGPPERFINHYQPELSLKKADETVSYKNSDMAQIGFKTDRAINPARIGFRCYREEIIEGSEK